MRKIRQVVHTAYLSHFPHPRWRRRGPTGRLTRKLRFAGVCLISLLLTATLLAHGHTNKRITGTDMAQSWWVIVPWAERNDQSRPPDARAYEVDTNSGTYRSWLGNSQTPVNIGGKAWTFIEGPFGSQSAAGVAQVQTPGIGAQLGIAAGGIITGSTGGAANPGNVLQKTTTAADKAVSSIGSVGQFLGILTEKSLWIRVGEVALGLILITAGTLKLAEGSGQVASAAGAAVRLNPASGVVAKGLKMSGTVRVKGSHKI